MRSLTRTGVRSAEQCRAQPLLDAGPATSTVCGELVADAGVRLRWPDGELTDVLGRDVTGLGAA